MNIQEGELFAGRYRLLTEKGRGAFGDVWLAHDEQIDLDVAIKIYIALDDRGIEDFKSEYKTAYTLNHPNLLHAYHFDVVENRPFLVMPYCPGSAESLVGCTDESIIWRFIRDVASGLDYLHNRNILHRDIKPDNILSDSEGTFLITDFGVSTKMKSTLRRNSTRAMSGDSISGTIGYMAPELFTRNPEAVKATDIWALGATLFEIINGELPFFGQGGIMMTSGAEIPELKGTWSKAMKATVEACLAKDTWDRPTAAQLAEYATKCVQGDIGKAPWRTNSAKSSEEGKKTVGESAKPSRSKTSGGVKSNSKQPQNRSCIKADGRRKKSWLASLIWLIVTLPLILLIVLLVLRESHSTPPTATSSPKGYFESLDAAAQGKDNEGNVNDEPVDTKNGGLSGGVEENGLTKVVDNNYDSSKQREESEQDLKLQSAIRRGDYTTICKMADNGYVPAYLPLAKHYLKTPSTHDLADKYARKAKSAGVRGAQSVLDDLSAMGFYD